MLRNNRRLSSIFLIVFIDLLGFGLILPLLPYYAETFGATDFEVGLLVAVYAAAQFVGTPLLGRLSDRVGRRPVLLISIAGNLVGFVLLALAQSLEMLFVARILAGFTGGNISVAQAYISDVTDARSRARGLGLIGAAFGLGFIIGPALGGLLSQWGFAVPALGAAALSLINFLLVVAWLPESLTAQARQDARERPPLTLRAMVEALRKPLVGPLLHTRFFFALAFSMFQTIFALYALRRFDLGARETGYILAYVGLLSVLVQGVAVGKLAQRFEERTLILASTALMALSLIGWALAPSVPVLLLILAPTALSGGVLNTVINSAISKTVAPIEVGGTLGIASALEALTRILSPAVGSLLLANLGTWAPGVFSGVLLLWLTTYVWRYVYRAPLSLEFQRQPVVKVTPEQ
ncbi:MFS transporter [Thermanaerothrix daxensis]|uniref:MFS transporter n=1 Tax=Thermanaerothrix daxensis TaxID=869279 RepID=A0A0P6Y0H0_9CHLR|nr:MFS transporter [Thermanaerothrix daxensis]KPL82356.1 MFS transporter [Thermanaerothrix daxensis]